MKKIDLQLTTESLLGMVSSVTGQYTAIVLVLFFWHIVSMLQGGLES